MTFAEMMFYAEAEGLLPTRTGKLNAVITDVKKYPAPSIDIYHLEQILNKHGLTYNQLSRKELRYIENGIR